jgi:hypothetical protein
MTRVGVIRARAGATQRLVVFYRILVFWDFGEIMANTTKWKSVSRSMRKGLKRAQRKNFKAVYAGLTTQQRAKFNDPEEKAGLRAFLAAQKK